PVFERVTRGMTSRRLEAMTGSPSDRTSYSRNRRPVRHANANRPTAPKLAKPSARKFALADGAYDVQNDPTSTGTGLANGYVVTPSSTDWDRYVNGCAEKNS